MVSKPGKTLMWWTHFGFLKPSQIDIPRFSVVEIHPGLLGRSSYRLHWPVALCVGESLDGSRATCWVKGNIHLDSCWSTAINGLVKSTNWKNGSSSNHRLQVFTDYYSIILFNTRPSLRNITKTAVNLDWIKAILVPNVWCQTSFLIGGFNQFIFPGTKTHHCGKINGKIHHWN